MNQILLPQSFTNSNNRPVKNKKKFKYIFLFFTCVVLICICIFISVKNFFLSKQDTLSSSNFYDAIKIQGLYDSNLTDNTNYPIIGKIEIPSININYPIFSKTNDELLKLGICRVYGPSINNMGNLCLAGHNYENNLFFSNIHLLKDNDEIILYDSFNLYVKYSVYSIFEVEVNNTSILSQNNSSRELTLITCNNKNKKRIIVKAKEID